MRAHASIAGTACSYVSHQNGDTPLAGELALGELRFAASTGVDVYRGPITDGAPHSGDSGAGDHSGKHGVFLYGDGARYEGAFRNGFFHGLGMFASRTRLASGLFENGELSGRATCAEARLVVLKSTPSWGAYFETPRLLIYVELAHGVFARGSLRGHGTRVASARLLDATHASARLLGVGSLRDDAATVAAPGSGSASGSAWFDLMRSELAEAVERARRAEEFAVALAGTGSRTSVERRATGPRTSTGEVDLVRLVEGAVGAREWLAQYAHAGLEVWRCVEHGAWQSDADESTKAAILGRTRSLLSSASSNTAGVGVGVGTPIEMCSQHERVHVLDALGALVETRSLAYAGACAHGVPHGAGTLTCDVVAAGESEPRVHDVYEGAFERGVPHGEGVLTERSGASYTGGFAGGVRHGRGERRRASGVRVAGVRVQGVKEGVFTVKWPNGDSLEYTYTRGVRHALPLSAAPTNARSRLFYALPARVRSLFGAVLGQGPVAAVGPAASAREQAVAAPAAATGPWTSAVVAAPIAAARALGSSVGSAYASIGACAPHWSKDQWRRTGPRASGAESDADTTRTTPTVPARAALVQGPAAPFVLAPE